MPPQVVGFTTVRRNACASPDGENATAPTSVMPRFSIRSPALAHTTIARTIKRVFARSLPSCSMLGLVVPGGSRFRNGDDGLLWFFALPRPLQALCAQLQKIDRFVV